jgi:CelD/BcsL family acetyltransferase involved in cellulose biosynthesis
VELLTRHEDLQALEPAWRELCDRSESENPFSDPAWAATWARHYVRPGDLCVIAVWDRERLIALAPFYRSRRVGSVPARRLRLLGTGGPEFVTELSEILALPLTRRRALRAILDHAHTHIPRWDWLELTLTSQQGWLELDFVADTHGSQVTNFFTDAFVVMSLTDVDGADVKLKRNMTESIRRARNRLRRDGHTWSVVHHTSPDGVDRGFEALATLHQARANSDMRVPHPDHMALPGQAEFVREALRGMAAQGNASIYCLEIDETPEAAMIVLRAGECVFTSLTGFNPRWWEYNIMTLLRSEVIRDAVRHGDRKVNLSRLPTNAKLRWSEETELCPHFAVVRDGVRARLAFKAFLHRRAQLPKLSPTTFPALRHRARRRLRPDLS